MKLYAQVFMKRTNRNTHFFYQIDRNTQQSHILVQPAAVAVVGLVTPSTGVAGCARCSWSQVSLLSCYSWCHSGILLSCILLSLDTYRDIVLWPLYMYRDTNRIIRHPYRYTPRPGQWYHIKSLVQDCGNSSALAMELPQSCTEPTMYYHRTWLTLVQVVTLAWRHKPISWINLDS